MSTSTYKMDKRGQVTEYRDGYRTNGPRKTRLINLVNQQMVELGSKGVNINTLLKVLGMDKVDTLHTTTKQWSGVLGMIKQFRRDNNI